MHIQILLVMRVSLVSKHSTFITTVERGTPIYKVINNFGLILRFLQNFLVYILIEHFCKYKQEVSNSIRLCVFYYFICDIFLCVLIFNGWHVQIFPIRFTSQWIVHLKICAIRLFILLKRSPSDCLGGGAMQMLGRCWYSHIKCDMA